VLKHPLYCLLTFSFFPFPFALIPASLILADTLLPTLARWIEDFYTGVSNDLFRFYSNVLAIALWLYFAIITVQSIWGWYRFLAGKDKYTSILRRYILVQGLRLRFRRFWGDILICVLLTVAFFLIWNAQWRMYDLEKRVKENKTSHVARAANQS
jgi:hypothetical protein